MQAHTNLAHTNQAHPASVELTSARRSGGAARPLCALLVAVLGIATPTLALRGGPTSATGTAGARYPVPALLELTGRFESTNSPGGYIDVHGPLGVYEALHACRYHDAQGRPIDAAR